MSSLLGLGDDLKQFGFFQDDKPGALPLNRGLNKLGWLIPSRTLRRNGFPDWELARFTPPQTRLLHPSRFSKGEHHGGYHHAILMVPGEVYEIYRHPSAIKCLVLIANIAVVIYLIYRIRTER